MRSQDYHDLFVCPDDHGKLRLEERPGERFLTCEQCGRRYPVDEHGIPHLLISEGDKYRRTEGKT